MTPIKRTSGQVQTIQWKKEKGQTDRYRQYNDKKKKDKWTGTDNTMTKRKRTNDKYRQYNDKKKKDKRTSTDNTMTKW